MIDSVILAEKKNKKLLQAQGAVPGLVPTKPDNTLSVLHLWMAACWLPSPLFIAGTRFDFSYLNRVLSAVANHPGQTGVVVRVWRSWSWLDAAAVEKKLSRVLELDPSFLALASQALVGRSRPACALVSRIYEEWRDGKAVDLRSLLDNHVRITRRQMVQELEKLTKVEPQFGVTLADYYLGLHRSWDQIAEPVLSLEAFHHQRDGVFHSRIHSHLRDWLKVQLGEDQQPQVSTGLPGATPSPALEPLARVALESFALKYQASLLTALANRVFGRATAQAGAAELDRLVALLLIFVSREGTDVGGGSGVSAYSLIKRLVTTPAGDTKAIPSWAQTVVLPRLYSLQNIALVDFIEKGSPEVRTGKRSETRLRCSRLRVFSLCLQAIDLPETAAGADVCAFLCHEKNRAKPVGLLSVACTRWESLVRADKREQQAKTVDIRQQYSESPAKRDKVKHLLASRGLEYFVQLKVRFFFFCFSRR